MTWAVSNLQNLDKAFARLARRAHKLGLEAPSYKVVGQHTEWELVGGAWSTTRKVDDLLTGRARVRHHVVVTGNPVVQLPGWELVGALDHDLGAGHTITRGAVPEGFRHRDNHCDHCGYARARRTTYVCRNTTTGEYVQVGSSCLGDFLGVDATHIVARMELALDAYRTLDLDADVGGGTDYYDIEVYLGHVVACIADCGWVSARVAREAFKVSTADSALERMRARVEVTPEHAARAHAVATWLANLPVEACTDNYLANLRVYGDAGVFTTRGAAIVASAVVAYDRAHAPEPTPVVAHVGKVGERLALSVRVLRVSTLQGNYGTTYLHKFEVTEGAHKGARLAWFGSKRLSDDVCQVKATVKAHNTYKGQPETLVTRVSA